MMPAAVFSLFFCSILPHFFAEMCTAQLLLPPSPIPAVSYHLHLHPHKSVFIVSTVQVVAEPAPDHTPLFSPHSQKLHGSSNSMVSLRPVLKTLN